jgi:hypothetical protein
MRHISAEYGFYPWLLQKGYGPTAAHDIARTLLIGFAFGRGTEADALWAEYDRDAGVTRAPLRLGAEVEILVAPCPT